MSYLDGEDDEGRCTISGHRKGCGHLKPTFTKRDIIAQRIIITILTSILLFLVYSLVIFCRP